MIIEVILREVGISINDIDHHRTPSDDVALLGVLFKADETANNVRTESSGISNEQEGEKKLKLKKGKAGRINLRNECSLGFCATALSFLSLVVIHPEENMHVGGGTAALLLQ